MRKTAIVAAAVIGTVGLASPAWAKSPPSFAKTKQALQSTGIKLCLIDSPPDNVAYVFGQTTTGDCSLEEPGSGLVHIYSESSNAKAKAQIAGPTDGDGVWIAGPIAVDDEKPAPGTNAALTRIGFKRVH